VNDLLGSGEIDKKKHEIKHEKVGKVMRTTVTDAAISRFPPSLGARQPGHKMLTLRSWYSQAEEP
jgi:hypothetical protein